MSKAVGDNSFIRVLWVNHVGRIGGAERSLLECLKHIDRRVFLPVAAVPADGPLSQLLTSLGVEIEHFSIRRHVKTTNPFRIMVDAARWLRGINELADIVRRRVITIIHANSTTALLYAGPAARMTGIPIIWHCRDMVRLGHLAPFLAGLSDKIIAVSCSAADSLIKDGVPSSKIQVLYNGIEIGDYSAIDSKLLRRMLNIPEKAPLIGMAAHMTPWKRHDLFLATANHILRSIHDAHFVIMGDAIFEEDKQWKTFVERLASSCPLATHVHLLGEIDNPSFFFKGLDVLVHPAENEPFGRVIVEAMAMGKPVIAAAFGGPAEIITHEENGILTRSYDDQAFANAVIRILEKPPMAGKLSVNAAITAAHRFNIRDLAKEIQSLHSETAECHSAIRAVSRLPRQPTSEGTKPALLFVVETFPCLTETFIIRELIVLRRLGYNVRLLAIRKGANHALQPSYLELLDAVSWLPAFFPAIISLYAHIKPRGKMRLPHNHTDKLSKLLWRLAALTVCEKNIQHVHAHFAFGPTRLAAAIASAHGISFSVSAHAADIHLQSATSLSTLLSGASFIRTCSRHGRNKLLEKTGGSLNDKLHVVYHGVELLSAPRQSPAEPLILAIGRLVEKKGFHHLVKACKHLADSNVPFRTLIVGDGPLRGKIMEEISTMRLESKVALLGPRSERGISHLLRSASLLAVPSVMGSDGDTDGIPNVVLEAMAAGVPVVASNIGGIPEAISDGTEGFLVKPGDENAFAERIKTLLSDPGLRNTMGVAARQKAAEIFDISTNVGRLAELLKKEVTSELPNGRIPHKPLAESK